MNLETKLIKNKLGLLGLAEELGNVSLACKYMGYSRDTFYRYKELFESGGEEGLRELSRKKPNIKNRIEEHIEKRVVSFAIEQPAFGQTRASNELKKEGNKTEALYEFVNLYSKLTEEQKKLLDIKVEENINLNPKSQYFKAVEQLASSKHVACHHKTQFGYSFFSKSKDSISSEELICLLFPYGSLAYGSALSELDLTGVKSKSVYFKTPSRSVWKKKALSDLPVVPEHLKKHFHLAKYSDYMLPIYPYEDIFINKQLIVLSEKNLNLENIITKENLRIQNHFDLL